MYNRQLLERPTSGKVLIDGVDITQLKEAELRKIRKKIGMIFQHFNLMRSRTVYQNIAYPLKGSKLTKAQIDKKVKDLLELVGLSEKLNAYPSEPVSYTHLHSLLRFFQYNCYKIQQYALILTLF